MGTNGNNYNYTNWHNHMSFYSVEAGAPILADIANCQLQQISWVIPDAAWSDHPNNNTGAALGPYWVANIVDAIGNSYANSGNTCDYWGNVAPSGSSARKPTAIFIVWDDWGGFYDHVKPYKVLQGQNNGTQQNPIWSCPSPPATNNWGCGYTYGFRVPFLVVSEYTGASTSGGGYISGSCTPPNCPNTTAKYQHDFGSILAFTEYNFNLPKIAPPLYADNNTIDSFNGNVPLSDFFSLYTGSGSTGRSFFQIPVTNFPGSFFANYYATHNATPAGPDPD
jgi:Phosphoesterase family